MQYSWYRGARDYRPASVFDKPLMHLGNALKMDTTEPSRGLFSFVHGDFEVNWARNHSQCVRGHTLGECSPQSTHAMLLTSIDDIVWYQQLPRSVAHTFNPLRGLWG